MIRHGRFPKSISELYNHIMKKMVYSEDHFSVSTRVLALFMFAALFLQSCKVPLSQGAPGNADGEKKPIAKTKPVKKGGTPDGPPKKGARGGDKKAPYGTLTGGILTVRSSVKSIPDSCNPKSKALFEHAGLTAVQFTAPSELTSIGDCAFMKNSIAELTVSGKVETIGRYAFLDNQLTTVKIGDSVKRIDSGAFGRNRIAKLGIGKSVEFIGQRAFYSNRLTEVVIPKLVREIESDAFTGNPDLKKVTISPELLNTAGEDVFPLDAEFFDHEGTPLAKPKSWEADADGDGEAAFGGGKLPYPWNPAASD